MNQPLQEVSESVKPSEAQPKGLPKWLLILMLVLAASGIAALAALLAARQSTRAWQIFLVNFLFWPGAAIGAVVWGAIFEVSKARWAGSVKRVAAASASLLPISFLFLFLIWFGRNQLFPWIAEPRPAISSWLSVASLFIRETVGLLLLYGLGAFFSFRTLSQYFQIVTQSGTDSSLQPKPAGSPALAVVLILLYCCIYTVFAWDFVMSLNPAWASTLFGGFYFIGNLYIGLAILVISLAYTRWRYGADELDSGVFHKLGKLLFSFSLLWTYLFWSQYLVIWYGNLPRETGFVLLRTSQRPWSALAVVVLIMNFVIPFIGLLSRSAKENPKVLSAVAAVIALGMWLERSLLVVPSLTPRAGFLGFPEALITLAFLSIFMLIYLTMLSRVPILIKGGNLPRA